MALRPPSRAQTPELRESSSRLPDNASRDNIKVSVRIRPLSEKESVRGDRAVWGADGSGGVGLLSAAGDRLDVKFAYDVVFSASNTNEQVFEQVAWPAIEPVLQGISGTVFAYGVTSSGKTHTMMGVPGDAGVVPRAIQALFDRIKKAEDSVYSVRLSMMEIYCEMLNDLLDSSKLNLDVQECQGGNGKGSVLVVKGLTEGKVASAEEALALIQQGQENRKVASTAYNDQSSRSHTICRLLVESTPRRTTASALQTAAAAADSSSRRGSNTGTPGSISGSFTAAGGNGSGGGGFAGNVSCTSAWLTLVDLAGSEGAKAALSKDQQAEARDINRSLLTLGKVMYELAKGGTAGHLPFRDSLLTRLLKPSLTGTGAKVAIICNVTPASSQSDETWNTLRFADGAKRIKVTAVKNEALDIAAVVAQYQQEVAALKAQLAALSGAAASAGGSLSPEVLQAIQATLDNSSKDNAADEMKDQAAQLQYLRECLSFASQERDQLLIMNKKMTAMLVQQLQQAATTVRPPPAAAAAAAAEGAKSTAGRTHVCEAPEACSSGWGEAAGAAVVAKAGRRAARLRRCLSYESLVYYSQWQGSKPDTPSQPYHQQQQQQQQQQRHGGMELTAGLECNAEDAAEVQALLRISSDELPESVTHGARNKDLQQQLQQQQQQQQREGVLEVQQDLQQQQQQEQETEQHQAAAATAFAAASLNRPVSSTNSVSVKGGVGLVFSPRSETAGIPPVLSKYYTALSSFAGLGVPIESSSSCRSSSSSNGGGGVGVGNTTAAFAPPAAAAAAAAAAAGGSGASVVPCPIVFPGSRRTSKTLAVAVPGNGGGAAHADGWLGCVGLPVLPEGVTKSALWEVVEAHKALAAQEARLDLLLQQLADKEELLQQARQLQQGQVLQLRLTITAADRALLRDKLAEAEQQIASYKAQQADYEQELQDMFNHIAHLQSLGISREQQSTQARVALAAQLALAALPSSASESYLGAAGVGGSFKGAIAPSEGLASQRSFSRCSSGRASPEPSGTRIPAAPGSPSRVVATFGGSPVAPAPSRIGGSISRSVGSPPKKSAAAAATFGSIKSAMMAAAAVGSPSSNPSSPLNSARSGGAPPAAAAAAAATAGSVSSSMSPRLSKLASKLPGLLVDDIVAGNSVVHLQPQGVNNSSSNAVRRAGSPSGSPLSISRNNSFLANRGVSSSPRAPGVLSMGPGAITASFTGSPTKEQHLGDEKDRDGKLRASWNSSSDTQQGAGLGAFNPICITSPFNEEVSLGPTGRGQPPREMDGNESQREPGSPHGHLRASADGKRTGSSVSSGQYTAGLLHSGKQSRIPLPPFLKRQSKRLLQAHREGDSSDSGGSAGGGGGPVMDRFLLGLHGAALPQTLEQQPSSDPSAGTAAAASKPAAQLQENASPFAAVAAAAAAAADVIHEDMAIEHEHEQGDGKEGDVCDERLLSVKSHPVELRASVVDGWSTRSSMCL